MSCHYLYFYFVVLDYVSILFCAWSAQVSSTYRVISISVFSTLSVSLVSLVFLGSTWFPNLHSKLICLPSYSSCLCFPVPIIFCVLSFCLPSQLCFHVCLALVPALSSCLCLSFASCVFLFRFCSAVFTGVFNLP